MSLRKLGLTYIELYLLHWPVPSDFDAPVASYKAAQKLLADGRVRAIGVSDFSIQDLESLMARSEVVPAVKQVELHPFFIQRELREFHNGHGITTQSWSPIGGVYNRNPKAAPSAAQSPLEHPTIIKLAAKYRKTPAQLVLRWHIDHGLSAIPKSVHPERIAENIDVFDFSLTSDEIASIDAIDTGVRAGGNPEAVNAQTFPIKIADE